MTCNVLMETLNPTDSTQLVFTCAKLLLCSDVLTTGDLSGENQRPVLCCRLCSLHRWNVALNCSSLIRSDVTYVPLWRASAVNGPKAHFALPICFLFFLDQLYWTSVSWHSRNFLTTRGVDLARKSYVLWALLHAKKWRPKTAAFLALFRLGNFRRYQFWYCVSFKNYKECLRPTSRWPIAMVAFVCDMFTPNLVSTYGSDILNFWRHCKRVLIVFGSP